MIGLEVMRLATGTMRNEPGMYLEPVPVSRTWHVATKPIADLNYVTAEHFPEARSDRPEEEPE